MISVIVAVRIIADEGGRPLVFHQIVKGEMSIEILFIIFANVAVEEIIILTTYHRGWQGHLLQGLSPDRFNCRSLGILISYEA